MPFPEVGRVHYEMNPLQEVICQVRFPTILRIDAETPAVFQEAIRRDYPKYEVRSQLKLPDGMPAQMLDMIAASAGRAHDFISRDDTWKLSLTRDFLALSCRDYSYTSWEEFRARILVGLEALSHYAPDCFTRVGLRYRNKIQRSRLNLGSTPWSELLRQEIVGLLGSVVAENVNGMQTTALIRLPDEIGTLRLICTIEREDEEEVFLIDGDYFTDNQVELAHAAQRLDAFNNQCRNCFRWCITGPLHTAMGPSSVEA